MKKILRSENEIKGFFCVDLQVKRRYINPLIKIKNGAKRISEVNKEVSQDTIKAILWRDGCEMYYPKKHGESRLLRLPLHRTKRKLLPRTCQHDASD